VVFVDRSSDFIVPGKQVPGAEYLITGSGIHAAIAGILNMSGAGKFFDELLDKYRDCGGSALLPSWRDLQRVAEEWKVKEDIRALFSHIQVSS